MVERRAADQGSARCDGSQVQGGLVAKQEWWRLFAKWDPLPLRILGQCTASGQGILGSGCQVPVL